MRARVRMFAARPLMMRPTASITAKVIRYSVSETANDQRGATKKKSNATTEATAASTDGPRPRRIATSVTARR